MKTIVLMLLVAQVVIYGTYPGTQVTDYSQPLFTIENGTVYKTYPGTTIPQYDQPRGTIEPMAPADSGIGIPSIQSPSIPSIGSVGR